MNIFLMLVLLMQTFYNFGIAEIQLKNLGIPSKPDKSFTLKKDRMPANIQFHNTEQRIQTFIFALCRDPYGGIYTADQKGYEDCITRSQMLNRDDYHQAKGTQNIEMGIIIK